MTCIKCKQEHDGDHECIEEMTPEELFGPVYWSQLCERYPELTPSE